MKIFKMSSFLMFVLFAVLQYNDVDPYIWMPIYLLAAMISLVSFLNRTVLNVVFITMILYALGFAYYAPSLIKWITEGMPSITGTMKANSPFVELIREALGLLICFVVMSIIYISDK